MDAGENNGQNSNCATQKTRIWNEFSLMAFATETVMKIHWH